MFLLTGISNASIKSNLGYGDPYKAEIAKGDIHYYGFVKHDNATYVVVLSMNDGDADLFGHWTYPFSPEDAIDEYTSENSNLSTDTITVNSTSDGWFYLAVYGYESSDYYITVCPQSYIKELDPVRLKSPGNNSSKSSSVKLEWYSVNFASSIEYRVFVSSSKSTLENISNVEAQCSNCIENKKTPNTYYQLNNLTPGRYYWMARAGHACGGSEANSNIWNFTVESNVVSLEISGPSTVGSNQSAQYKATAKFDDGSTKDVTSSCNWSVSSYSYASINSSGKLTVKSIGNETSVYVKANYSKNSRTVDDDMRVKLIPPSLISIEISGPSSVGSNQSGQYKATAKFDDGSSKDVTSSCNWSVSSYSYASINSSGKLTVKSISNETSVYVKANYSKNSRTVDDDMQVKLIPPTLISIEISGPSSVGSNQSGQYKATATFNDNTTKDVTNICTWSLSSTSYASINSSSGKLTVRTIDSDKSVYVKVSYSKNGKTVNDDQSVSLIPPILTSIEISGSSSVKSGQSAQYKATAKFDDATTKDVTNICNWSLSSTSYASINSSGKLTVRSLENDKSVYVRVNYSKNGKTVNDDQSVSLIAPILTSIEISGSSSVKSGQSAQFKATAKFDDSTSKDVTNICNWSLSSTSYASINSSGKVTVRSLENDKSVYVRVSYSKNGKTVNDDHSVSLIAPIIQSIEIECPSPVKSNQCVQFRVIANYTDGTTKDITNLCTWILSSTSHATINNSGKLCVKNIEVEASVIVKVNYSQNGITESEECLVNLIAPILTSIEISGPSLVKSNQSGQYKAIAKFDDSTTKDVTNICNWTLSSTSYATINGSSGKLTVRSIESDKSVDVKVSYSKNGKTVNDNQPVNLIAPILTSIEISGPSSVKSNQSGQYKATVIFDDGTSKDVTNICTWSLSSTSNASINSSSGKLTVRSIETDTSIIVKVNYSKNGKTVNDDQSVSLLAPIQLPPVIKSFNINNNESETSSRTVILFISAINTPTFYKASETQNLNDVEWQPYVENPEFILSSEYGPKRVYIRLKNEGGESEEISFDDITLKQQEAPELLVTPLEQDISSKGDSFTIQVKNVGTGSLTWDATIKNNPDWLSINSEFDNGIITVTCLANIDSQRTGEIVISSENATNSPQIVTITQSEYMRQVILALSDAEGAPGSEGIPVQISLDNISDNAPVSSIQLVLKYDSNIAKSSGFRTTQRTEGFTVNLTPKENGKNSEIIILLYSMAGLSIDPEKGSILEILFDVEQNAQEDESFVLQFNECTVSNKDGNEIQSDFSDTGIFLVTSPCHPCDVNCDGNINILDLQIIIKHIIERTYLKEADLNEKDGKIGDGKVNVLDLQTCLNCILDQFNNASVKRIKSQVNFDQQNHALYLTPNFADSELLDSKTMNSLSFTPLVISENSTGTIGLNLSNQDIVASGQIKIEYDSSSGFEINDVFSTDRTDSFEISFSKQNISSDKSAILILFYSMSGSTIEPGFGDIFKLNYSSGNNSGKVSLVFTETILSDTTGNELPVSTQASDNSITEQPCLDTNQDGQVDLIDVIYILQYLNGIILQ